MNKDDRYPIELINNNMILVVESICELNNKANRFNFHKIIKCLPINDISNITFVDNLKSSIDNIVNVYGIKIDYYNGLVTNIRLGYQHARSTIEYNIEKNGKYITPEYDIEYAINYYNKFVEFYINHKSKQIEWE